LLGRGIGHVRVLGSRLLRQLSEPTIHELEDGASSVSDSSLLVLVVGHTKQGPFHRVGHEIASVYGSSSSEVYLQPHLVQSMRAGRCAVKYSRRTRRLLLIMASHGPPAPSPPKVRVLSGKQESTCLRSISLKENGRLELTREGVEKSSLAR
jgi:hypothetical protein